MLGGNARLSRDIAHMDGPIRVDRERAWWFPATIIRERAIILLGYSMQQCTRNCIDSPAVCKIRVRVKPAGYDRFRLLVNTCEQSGPTEMNNVVTPASSDEVSDQRLCEIWGQIA